MIETACPAAFDPELAKNFNHIRSACFTDAQLSEFLPIFVKRALAHWKDRRATEASKKKSEAVFKSLDARALYDVGATDIVNSGPRLF